MEQTASLSMEKYASLFQTVLRVASEALHAVLQEDWRVSDATYERLDQALHSVWIDVRVATAETEITPVADTLANLELDFLDVCALVEGQERQAIVSGFDDCDNLLSKAKELAGQNLGKTRQILEQVSTEARRLDSRIETSKVSAFDKAIGICFGLWALGIISPILPTLISPKTAGETSPYVTIIIICLIMVTVHVLCWTKSKTAKQRIQYSNKLMTWAVFLAALLAIASQAKYWAFPFEQIYLLYMGIGMFVGVFCAWVSRRLVVYASKLKGHKFGLNMSLSAEKTIGEQSRPD